VQGTLDHELGRLRQALQLRPGDAQLHHALGNMLYSSRRPAKALASYEVAIRLRPGYVEAYNDRGLALQALGRDEEALASYSEALALRPNYPEACYNRANAHAVLRQFAAADADYRKAIATGLRRPEVYNNLALALGELGRAEEAIDNLRRALDIQPAYAEGWYNLGSFLERLGRADEAIPAYERVLELAPDHVGTRWNLSLLKLQRGELQEGWRLHEARFAVRAQEKGRTLPLDEHRWTGRESLKGSRILLWNEGGFGDTLQWCRYAPLIRDLGAEVTLEVQPQLKALLDGQFPGVNLIGHGEQIPPYDYQCSLISVPGAFGTELATIPAAASYLRADPAAAALWSRKLPSDRPLRIGLVWQGNSTRERGPLHGRSWPLAALEPLARQNGLRLISLQVGPGAEQLASVGFADRIVSFGEELDAGPNAFLDTTAILMSLDLMISCDTSVAHLAGALGVPVWLGLPANSEWRWLLGRTDSPWYPSMRLFRQPVPGDWHAVVSDMCRALAGWPGAAS
jgi:Flp pilus assembly protein TadD